jgi:tetratricopeptide (TPR) repeat protein
MRNAIYEQIKISWFCLALLSSILGCHQEAYEFAEKSYIQPDLKNQTTPWAISYRFLFLAASYRNLRNIDKSFEMYRRAISFAEESHYTQVKAKALTGLAELYRDNGDFETALLKHSDSIQILDAISAKCDLAEAYFQRGLTYQKMGGVEKSQEDFDKAIQLFSEMEAPKQVEKVRQTMESGGCDRILADTRKNAIALRSLLAYHLSHLN